MALKNIFLSFSASSLMSLIDFYRIVICDGILIYKYLLSGFSFFSFFIFFITIFRLKNHSMYGLENCW